MGVRISQYVVFVWTLTGVLTTAAIIGSMRSFLLTVIGGVAIGMIESVPRCGTEARRLALATIDRHCRS